MLTMLAYVPPPPRGATVYAILASIERLSPELKLVRLLLGPRATYARPLWPRGLGPIAAAMPPPLDMTAQRLLHDHTLVPAFLPFMTPERRERLVAACLRTDAGEPARLAGATELGMEIPEMLRACPLCVQSRCTWWLTFHQMPGALVCAVHPDVVLHDTTVLRSPREDRRRHVDLRDARLLGPCAPELSPQGLQRAAEVSVALRTLLLKTLPHPGPEKFRQWMREQLRAQGFVAGSRIDLKGCVAALRSWMGEDFCAAAGVPLPRRADDGNWFVDILTARRIAIHPTFAVVCSLFVGTGIEAALEAAENFAPQPQLQTRPMRRGISAAHARFEQAKDRLRRLWAQPNLSVSAIARQLQVCHHTVSRWAAALGLPFPRRGPKKTAHGLPPRRKLPAFGVRVREHRRQWLEALRHLPRGAGAARHPRTRALYAWLSRYDPNWLRRHWPKPWRQPKVDWLQRDRDISARIAVIAAELRARTLPTRASRTRIIAILGIAELFHSSARMPKAHAALNRHAESHREFVPRRLRALFDAGILSRRALVIAAHKRPSLRQHPLLVPLPFEL